MGTVRSIHLQEWAGTVDARNKLGELIRHLIHAGLPIENIHSIQFLANEANQLSGWDGVLNCSSHGPWIPEGQSVWELGSGKSSRNKVEDDFSKRDRNTSLPKGWYKKDTTYVAASLGKFDDRVGLERELSKKASWKAVQVVDAAVFEEWVENHLGVETWLQEQGVGARTGVTSLQRFWADWSGATKPPINEELLRCNRSDAIGRLLALLQEEECVARIKSDSPEEATAFLYAAMQSLGGDKSSNLLSKSIVLRDPSDVTSVVHLPQHIICVTGESASKANELSRNGHKVICPLGRSSLARQVEIELGRPLRQDFSNALEDMGVAGDASDTEARACGNSASIWRVWNQLDYGGPDFDLPDWAGSEHTNVVVPAILAGGWSESNEEDKKQIELISGLKYNDFRDQLQRYLTYDNPLMQKVGDAWVVSAPATAFAITINNVNTGHLERLRVAIGSVFSEEDPSIDVPPDERMYGGLKSEGLSHSRWMRDGLAESLLRIAVLGSRLEENSAIPNGQTCQGYVDDAITELIGLSNDWRLITSLRSQLPVLAEAAPAPFLKALDRLLQGHPESIAPIFEEGSSFSGYSFHSEVLWALETLAWEPEYLPRVALVLAYMAELDPGGRLNNRPINSLKEIFLAWHPGTAASLEKRLAVINLILDQVPQVGWELIVGLMPSGTSVSHTTNRPIWRDFSLSDRPVLTRGDVWQTYKDYFGMALRAADGDPVRLCVLLDSYENIGEEEQDSLRESFRNLSADELSPEAREVVWEQLRQVTTRHSRFPDAAWSLSSEKILELTELQESFALDDSIDSSAWLFNEQMPDLPSPIEDFDKIDSEVARLRVEAISAVLAEHGLAGLLELANKVGFPGIVGAATADVLVSVLEALPYVGGTVSGTRSEQIFCESLSSRMFFHHGDGWRDRILEYTVENHSDTNVRVRPFLMLKVDSAMLDFLAKQGPDFEHAFWSQRTVWNIDRERKTLTQAVRNFVESGRAMDVLMLVGHEMKKLGTDVCQNVLDAVLAENMEGKNLSDHSNSSYYIEQIFEYLANSTDVSLERLAILEYAYLPLLSMKRGDSTLVLHRYLSAEPEFFVTVICDLYRPESATEPREQKMESVNKATLAWEMLHSWRNPPGLREDGEFESSEFSEWIANVRELAKEKDRTTMSEQHIGHILYHLPRDAKDHQWPLIQARNAVENIINDEISSGFQIEQFNARGVTSKVLYEGGAQERALEALWNENAKALEMKWPKISELCKQTGASWAREALREDERAAKDRLKYE